MLAIVNQGHARVFASDAWLDLGGNIAALFIPRNVVSDRQENYELFDRYEL